MRQLIYCSRWTPAARRDIAHTLQQVVGQSIQNNRLADVTGFLIAQDGLFLQLLEGPARGVGETLKRIGADPRHAQIKLISDIETSSRLFQQWNMAGQQGDGQPLDVATLDAESARGLLMIAAAREQDRERRLIA